ncbi:hypothetical protein [Ethanoligenens sp.]|uniref:hypothetical protein n=1 Tax=Ethanoligenens sp. TaxID=2099655 RepID=UPI0039E9FF85
MYADMVLMMGGTLVATSEDNLSNSLYTSVFPAVSGIPGSMPANGQAMTTDQADALANMPAKSRPQAVVADSATFSGSGQAAETILNQAQIKVLVMEDTTGSPLTDAVFSDSPFVTILHNTYYIGQMLKDKCSVNGKSADAVATNFEDFYKNNVNGGSGSLHNQYGDYYVPPSTDAADFTKRHDSGYVDGFVLHPPTEQTDPGLTYAQFNAEMDSIIPNVRNPALDIGTTTFFPPIGLDGLYNQYFKSSVKMINSRSFTKPGPVGDTVANNYDFEMFCNQIIVTSNHTTDNQYTVRIPARACYGNVIIQIAGEIKLNLQPSGLHGVHTWLSGAPESVLEPLWLAAVYHPSDHSMGDFSNTLTKFYSTFFHHSLTPDELHQIMRNS